MYMPNHPESPQGPHVIALLPTLPYRVEQQLLTAQPGSQVTFGAVVVDVYGYGFEARGLCNGEWVFNESLGRQRAAARAATAICESLAASPPTS